MATEFICTCNKANEDYGSVASWEAAVQSDLTSAQTRVYLVASIAGTVADGATVVGQNNGYTATVRHVNNAATSPYQVLVFHDSGAETFENNEELWVDDIDNTNMVVLAATAGDNDDTAIAVLDIYDDDGSLSSETWITGFTTSATNKIILRAPEGDRHDGTLPDGTAGDGAILAVHTWGFNHACIGLGEEHIDLEWLAITGHKEYDGGGIITFGGVAASGVRTVKNCIIYSDTSGSNALQTGINCSKGNATTDSVYIQNCIVYHNSYGIRAQSGLNAYIYNCTFYNNNSSINVWGFNYNSQMSVKNTVSVGNADDFYQYTGGNFVEAESGNNCSEDANPPGANDVITTQNLTTQFFISATDLHLRSTSDAIDAGEDLGTSPDEIETDIDGRDRDAKDDTWDIGADEGVFKVYSKENNTSLPTDAADLELAFTSTEYSNVATDDSVYATMTGSGTKYLIKQFKNKYQLIRTGSDFKVTFNGKTTRSLVTSPVYLQLYNWTTDIWNTFDVNNTSTGSEFTLTGASVAPNVYNYTSGSSWITGRIYQGL